jgi:hypothetical protein
LERVIGDQVIVAASKEEEKLRQSREYDGQTRDLAAITQVLCREVMSQTIDFA